jgi:hypothetical protein
VILDGWKARNHGVRWAGWSHGSRREGIPEYRIVCSEKEVVSVKQDLVSAIVSETRPLVCTPVSIIVPQDGDPARHSVLSSAAQVP